MCPEMPKRDLKPDVLAKIHTGVFSIAEPQSWYPAWDCHPASPGETGGCTSRTGPAGQSVSGPA